VAWLALLSVTTAQRTKQVIPTNHKIKWEYNVQIPMRDRVKLSANISRPDAQGRFPVIVDRTPYGKNRKGFFDPAAYFAQRGYVYVVEDCRGRYDSEGTFTPWINEGHDGYDTIEWAARQPWSNGDVGTTGGSYGAWDQWFAAEEQPEHLKTMIVLSTPPDPYPAAYQAGAFGLQTLDWAIIVDGHTFQEYPGNLAEVYHHLPVRTMDGAAGRSLAETFRAWTQHETYDDYWKPRSYETQLSRVRVSVLHIDGWYDAPDATLKNYNEMFTQGALPQASRRQKVILGPWLHQTFSSSKVGDIDFGPEAPVDLKEISLNWYDCRLKGINCDQVEAEGPIKLFVMGENHWRSEQEWPLKRTRFTPFYLHSQGHANTGTGDGILSWEAPGNEPVDTFTYDPNDPIPSTDDPGTMGASSVLDERQMESRKDVLVFTTAPLEEPVEVTGPIRVKLWAASSAPDTDWVAKLIDVHPNGEAQRLQDGIVRARFRGSIDHPSLTMPLKIYEYTIDLLDTSNLFQKGHHIQVAITSSNFPDFDRNLNTGKSDENSTEIQVAKQTIYHDAAHPSYILLPIIPRDR
jgi:putative CocE/NonD family hydrolase